MFLDKDDIFDKEVHQQRYVTVSKIDVYIILMFYRISGAITSNNITSEWCKKEQCSSMPWK